MQLERLACSTRAAGVGVEESGVGVGPALSPASGRVHGPGAGSRPEPAQRPGTARRHETRGSESDKPGQPRHHCGLLLGYR